MKATICVDVDSLEEVAAVDAWFTTWRDQLVYCSENSGCGCCVNIWDIDGPSYAIAELPATVLATSDWSTSGSG